ncbi:signal recognition particle protein [Cokeromyces recurvatus]|uniref:signal recognition particle protein n=1 Tax=Cokeromyces recurvatus TaxID=90255 RepID=UPI00221EF1B4|nr:signal recognition particle protein [Cokeromyces recurvatus]KAI7900044.1 signal recognition particle protein [Cokeromyces recurvatus]
MVLADLGRKINSAFAELTKAPVIDEKVLDSLIKEICAALLSSDVNVRLVQKLRTNIKKSVNLNELANGTNKKRMIEKAVMDELCHLVDPEAQPYKPVKRRTNIFMMVGLQGAGKTTTCTKIASFYQRKGWKVALVCADTFRAGAFDQLKQNATKAKIPYYGSYTETDPVAIALEGVEKFKAEKFEIIIVDTSGRHKQEIELFEEMKQISNAVKPDTTIFVMDGTIGQAAESQAKAFKEAADFGSIIITKMDGHAKGGGAISAVAATHSPIIFIGTGEHLQDMERFEPKSFIRKVLGMHDMRDVIEQVQDTMQTTESKKLMKNIEKGQYSLRDMYDQFQQVAKMGPLSKLMGSIPGMSPEMMAGTEQESSKRMKRMMCIMDSMTDEELDGDHKPFDDINRVIRVARGSGTTVHEVQEILSQYKKFADMVKTMGGKNGLMQNMPTDPRKMSPAQMAQMGRMQQQMANMVPPHLLQQMGGMEGLQRMARQMGGLFGRGGGLGGGGGMPDMAQLMKAMNLG